MKNFIFIAALATLASGRAISRAQDALSTSTDDHLKLESRSADKHDPLYGKYIHYPVLYPNNVPCDQRSGMKGNCKPGPPVNTYHRGCSAITRCRAYSSGRKGGNKGTKKEGEETEEETGKTEEETGEAEEETGETEEETGETEEETGETEEKGKGPQKSG